METIERQHGYSHGNPESLQIWLLPDLHMHARWKPSSVHSCWMTAFVRGASTGSHSAHSNQSGNTFLAEATNIHSANHFIQKLPAQKSFLGPPLTWLKTRHKIHVIVGENVKITNPWMELSCLKLLISTVWVQRGESWLINKPHNQMWSPIYYALITDS